MISALVIFMAIGILSAWCLATGLAQAASDRREWRARIPGDDASDYTREFTMLTIAIPEGGGVYQWTPNGPMCLLTNCPAGLFIHKGEIGIKEFSTGEARDAICMMQIGTNFRMWSRAADLWVQPITMQPVDPAPFWIEQQ